MVDELVRRGDLVLDIGAAEGFYAARLSQLVGRQGRVHSFEPNPVFFAELEELSGRRANITTHYLGLSDEAGEAELHIPVWEDNRLHGMGSVSVPAGRSDIEHRTVAVRLERLDAVLSGEDRSVGFVKCDVEGHEPAVLRGAERTLRDSLPGVLIEIEQRHQDTRIEDTFAYLERLGYVGYSAGLDGLRPLEEFDVERDQLAFLSSSFEHVPPEGYLHNFLFVPPTTDVGPLLAR